MKMWVVFTFYNVCISLMVNFALKIFTKKDPLFRIIQTDSVVWLQINSGLFPTLDFQ